MDKQWLRLPGWGFLDAVWKPLAPVFSNLAGLDVNWEELASPEDITERATAALKAASASGKNSGVIVAGWSLGAITAMELAIAFPEMVDRLILIAPTASFVKRADSDPGWDDRILRRMQKRLAKDAAGTLEDFIQNMFSGTERTDGRLGDLLPAVKEVISTDSPVSLARGLDYLRQTNLCDRLEEIRQPVLLIHGKDDAICPVQASREIADHVSGPAELVELDEAGHLPFYTEQAACINAIQRFMMRPVGGEDT